MSAWETVVAVAGWIVVCLAVAAVLPRVGARARRRRRQRQLGQVVAEMLSTHRDSPEAQCARRDIGRLLARVTRDREAGPR